MMNIILADDHSLVRYGIKLLLQTDINIAIVGEASGGTEVLDLLKSGVQADIILADLNMPKMNGHQLMEEIRIQYPAIRIVVLTMMDDDNSVSNAFKNGASGYLLKDIVASELVYALNHVYCGGKYISAKLSHKFFEKSLGVLNIPAPAAELALTFSSREMEVLELISNGFTNSEMSEKLFISKRTIEGHRQSLIDKTKCRNTAALIKYAVLHRLIT